MEFAIVPVMTSPEVLSDLPDGCHSANIPSFKVTVRIPPHGDSLPFDTMLLRPHESVETQVGHRWAKQEVSYPLSNQMAIILRGSVTLVSYSGTQISQPCLNASEQVELPQSQRYTTLYLTWLIDEEPHVIRVKHRV